MSKGQGSPLTVRLPGGLRAQIDEAAEESGLSRNAWIVRVLERALTDGAGPPPKPDGARSTPGLGPKQVRVESDGARFWLVGVKGRVPEIEAPTEASVRRVAQREGYEVVGP
jgi:HicB family